MDRRRLLLMVAVLVTAIVAPVAADTTGGMFTSGATSMPFSGALPSGWDLIQTGNGSMNDIDLVSGHPLHDLGHAGSRGQLAEVVDLTLTNGMAVDLLEIEARVRARAEQERRNNPDDEESERADRSTTGGVSVGRDQIEEMLPVVHFSGCGHPDNAGYQARVDLVELFEVMCQDAAADGVAIRLNSAWRDPAHQYRLFRDAVAKYGSEREARRWVAWSDGTTCGSQHCKGNAIDISLSRSPGARAWLHAPVGCLDGNRLLNLDECDGRATVARHQTYGFYNLPHEPWHFEVGVRVAVSAVAATCDPPPHFTVPEVIASVFRCELDKAGLDPTLARQVTAEALVVSKCESIGWQTHIVAFNGKYVDTPHPRTGDRYTARGVFQFIRATANQWVPGGYAATTDPVASSQGAARLWLHGHQRGIDGWTPWACAVPVHDGVNIPHSVLPGREAGPAVLPDWAYGYV